jgi:hypothetical protein
MEIVLLVDPESVPEDTILDEVEDNEVGLELNDNVCPMINQPIVDELVPDSP